MQSDAQMNVRQTEWPRELSQNLSTEMVLSSTEATAAKGRQLTKLITKVNFIMKQRLQNGGRTINK